MENSSIKNASTERYKPDKGPSAQIDNSFIKMLDSAVGRLEALLGKRRYLCGNPNCGTLIVFHTDELRPAVCHRCGSEIDWEGEYITRIMTCPKCNKQYSSDMNYCPFHAPAVQLIQKEVEKHPDKNVPQI